MTLTIYSRLKHGVNDPDLIGEFSNCQTDKLQADTTDLQRLNCSQWRSDVALENTYFVNKLRGCMIERWVLRIGYSVRLCFVVWTCTVRFEGATWRVAVLVAIVFANSITPSSQLSYITI